MIEYHPHFHLYPPPSRQLVDGTQLPGFPVCSFVELGERALVIDTRATENTQHRIVKSTIVPYYINHGYQNTQLWDHIRKLN